MLLHRALSDCAMCCLVALFDRAIDIRGTMKTTISISPDASFYLMVAKILSAYTPAVSTNEYTEACHCFCVSVLSNMRQRIIA